MQDSIFEKTGLPEVKVVVTTPKVSEDKLFKFRKCYIGISLDNPVFYEKSLLAILSWAVSRFDQCLIILGDSLRRYNEYIFNGLKESEAQKASYQVGDNYILQTKEIFSRFREPKVTLIRWQDCLQMEEFRKSIEILDRLYAGNNRFKASVQKDAFAFIKRQKRKNEKLAVTMEQAIEISSQYLLEEIAVFSALSERGWNVELYPGPELGVLVDVAKGNYADIPMGLKERINVQLSVSRPE
jgi:tRNA-dependent cyclodipeptide synthase